MRNIATLPFYCVMALLLLLMACSCRSVHVNKTRTEQHIDSVNIVKVDSSHVHKADSIGTTMTHDSIQVSQAHDYSRNIVIEVFSDSSPIKKRITINETGHKTKTQTENRTENQQSHTQSLDTADKKATIETTLHKDEKTSTRQREVKGGTPIGMTIILLIIFVLIILYIIYRVKQNLLK